MGRSLSIAAMLMVATTVGASAQDTPPASAPPAHAARVDLTPRGEQLCLPDGGACLSTPANPDDASSAPMLMVSEGGPVTNVSTDIANGVPLPYQPVDRETVTLWPHAIAMPASDADGAPGSNWLIGIITHSSTMYSGGGGEAQRLHLHRARINGTSMQFGDEVLNVPLSSSLMIRACFSDADMRKRRGACHDEYRYGANIVVAADDSRAAALPDLVYAAQATAYPQTARRGEDSSAAPPLTRADLSTWTDGECSYSRRLAFNPATERYEMDRPAPDCSQYTQP